MKHALLMIVLQLAATGADAYYTNHNMHNIHFYEGNPIERPFTRNTTMLVGEAVVETGSTLYFEHWLEKHGHRKMATTLRLEEIGGHGFCAAYSRIEFKPVVK